MTVSIAMELTDFVKGDLKGIKYVDYWAVDFDYGKRKDLEGNLIFTNHWEDFRTKKDRRLENVSGTFECDLGPRQVAVKVIDIWSNETLKVVSLNL